MACTLIGIYPPKLVQDEDGHRDYTVDFLIYTDDKDNDGPYDIIQTPGLPSMGDSWDIYGGEDEDAWCRHTATVSPLVSNDGKPEWYRVEKTFSTRPYDYCKEDPTFDPLEEPDRITGGCNKYSEEGLQDYQGKPIKNSAHEPIHGPQNEWDASRFFIKIEQNREVLEFEMMKSLINHVNKYPMWAEQARCVKFDNFNWTIKYRGDCDYYYVRTLEFEIRRDTFDRDILDEGTKVLNGHWNQVTKEWVLDNIHGAAPNPNNPNHFIRAMDPRQNPIRLILDGHGSPWVQVDNAIKWWCINDGTNPFTFEGTCSEAVDLAIMAGAGYDGPWNSEGQANSSPGCDVGGFEDTADPFDAECLGDGVPGRIHVKKYLEANLFLLDLPADIDRPQQPLP